MVRSQEIDHAGEAGFTFQARQVMDTVIDNLARDPQAGRSRRRALCRIGGSWAPVLPVRPDESMRIGAPGDEVDLHRRCWIGRGDDPIWLHPRRRVGSGYESDLRFRIPSGAGYSRLAVIWPSTWGRRSRSLSCPS